MYLWFFIICWIKIQNTIQILVSSTDIFTNTWFRFRPWGKWQMKHVSKCLVKNSYSGINWILSSYIILYSVNPRVWISDQTSTIRIRKYTECLTKLSTLSYLLFCQPQLSQLFLNRFSKFLCLSCSKFPKFFKNVPLLQFAWVDGDKRANN